MPTTVYMSSFYYMFSNICLISKHCQFITFITSYVLTILSLTNSACGKKFLKINVFCVIFNRHISQLQVITVFTIVIYMWFLFSFVIFVTHIILVTMATASLTRLLQYPVFSPATLVLPNRPMYIRFSVLLSSTFQY